MKKKNKRKEKMETKTSWWSLKIYDYPNYKPSETDLEHIAKCIIEGYDNGELIQEEE